MYFLVEKNLDNFIDYFGYYKNYFGSTDTYTSNTFTWDCSVVKTIDIYIFDFIKKLMPTYQISHVHMHSIIMCAYNYACDTTRPARPVSSVLPPPPPPPINFIFLLHWGGCNAPSCTKCRSKIFFSKSKRCKRANFK